MKTTVSSGYTKAGRPHTTVQAGEVYNDVLYTASVDARGGLALAKEHAVNLVRYSIAQAKTRDFADSLGSTGEGHA